MKKFFSGVRAICLWAMRVVVVAACGLLSLFLLASGYEAIYNRSLPFVHTVDAVSLAALEQNYDLPEALHTTDNAYGSFGKPSTVKFPNRSARVNVADAVHDGNWLARANTMHMLIATPPRDGNIGLLFLYCRAGFRTISPQNAPAVGANLFMDTENKWRYVYRVSSSKVLAADVPYVAADSGTRGKLVLFCNDQAAHANVIVEADLLSVQGVEL